MDSITAVDAKLHFGALLDRVVRGKSVVITRRGQPVARMTPVHAADSAARSAAIDRLLRFSAGRTLGELTIRGMIDEGRR